MADVKAGTASIFAVSGTSDLVQPLPRTRFSKHGIGEVRNLQKWVLSNPEVLDEDLLVIAREYDGFDKSNKRLDILALDRDGKLVVVELKLDTSGHFADLQAINYAAMVSTLTMDMAIELLSRHARMSLEEARDQIADFLNP